MKILKKTILLVIFSFLLSNLCIAQEAEEHFKRGVGYFETRLIDKAIAEFKKALHLFKEDQKQMKAETYVTLANAYNRKGIHKAAITACKKAMEIDPNLANAHYNLGFAYREEGNDELAKQEFALYDELLKQEGEYIEIPEKPTSEDIDKYITLGDNYFKEGKFDEAITEYKKALEIKPRDDILNKLGQAHQQKRLAGKPEEQPAKIDTFTSKKTLDEMPGLEREQELVVGRVILFINSELLTDASEQVFAWIDGAGHFADVICFTHRKNDNAAAISKCKERFETMRYPLETYVIGSKKPPPIVRILAPTHRRISHVFDPPDLLDPEDSPQNDPYLARLPNGRRERSIPSPFCS